MKKTAHIISHSHWDREWYLPFEKHRYYFIKLMNHLIEQFKKEGNKFQSFHLDGQTVLLEDYFAVHPENREIVKQLIEEKKLHIGPWYVLQDAFLTSSEANIRNLQIGLYDTKAYGQAAKIGYFPDTFGIYGQAPQILKQAGIDTAAFGRGVKPTGFNNTVSDTPNFESPYSEMVWESPDGSSVLGILFANWYSNGNEIPIDEEEAKVFWDKKLQDAEKYASTNQLLFMNGCDHQPLQTTIPQAIDTAAALYPDYTFKHSSFDEYTAALKESLSGKLQVIEGELRNQRTDGWSTLVNTASSRIYLKQWNNHCQTLLEKVAEPLAAINLLAGGTYPREYIRFMWKSLMKNHPHDSICGCSVDEVHREMVTRFETVSQMGDVFIKEKAAELCKRIDTSKTPESGIPLVVINQTGWERTDVLTEVVDLEKVYFSQMHFEEIPVYLQDKQTPSYKLIDDQGKTIEYQLDEPAVEFGYDLPHDKFRQPFFSRRARLSFFAEGIPAFGYKTFYLVPAETPVQLTEPEDMEKGTDGIEMENEYVHLHFHEDGSFDLMHKETGKSFHRLGIYEDTGDIGNEYMYKEAKGHAAITTKGMPAQFKFLETTNLRTVLEIAQTLSIPASADDRLAIERNQLVCHKERVAGRSSEMTTITLRTVVTLAKGMKGPAFKLTIDNQATDHRLRVLFPTGLKTDTHKADSIFEIVTRPNTPEKEWENPSFCHHQQRFSSLADDHMGLTVATDGLQEYEILPEGTIAVTVLRSTAELGDWGSFPTPEAQCLGIQTAEWQVLPHEKDVIQSQAFVDAYQYKVPLVVDQPSIHKGVWPTTHQFVTSEANGLAWSSMKVAEERDDVMIRWFNPAQEKASLTASIKDYQSYKSTILEERTKQREDQYEAGKSEIITLGFYHKG